MTSRASTPPEPWAQRELRTFFLRVPESDWLGVKHGRKREFRRRASGVAIPEVPTPVVAYRFKNGLRHDRVLMVLERTWREPLGAISEDSLAREGYSSLAEFRRYWKIREKRPFRPLDEVQVYQVRLWEAEDIERMGRVLVARLYAEHLPPGQREEE